MSKKYMYENRKIELDLISINLIEKNYLSVFNRKQILTLIKFPFKINALEINYFMDRMNRNIILRNKIRYLTTPIKLKNKVLEQQRLKI